MRIQFSLLLVTLSLCATLAARAQIDSGTASLASDAIAAATDRVPDLQAVIAGLEAAQRNNHAHMGPFTVTREYELFKGDDKNPKGTVVAAVHFQPPTTKTWEIEKTNGSNLAEKVVRYVLEREVKYAKDGRIAITHEDYGFLYAGTGEDDHRPCYVLQLVPKRDNINLLRGKIWVDRDTYLIHRFEGEPAKSPAWWMKDIKLITSYGNWGGTWLPTISKGVADVRLFGTHTMTARMVSYRAGGTVLEGPAQPGRLRSHQPRPSSTYRSIPSAVSPP